jgi:predicted Zn-dependent protease
LDGTARTRKCEEHTLHTTSGLSFSYRFFLNGFPYLVFSELSVLAPHELGGILECASSDGKVSLLTFKSMSLSNYALLSAHSL